MRVSTIRRDNCHDTIGDAVNTASRLEALSKDYGAQLVFSAVVSEKAGLDLAGFPRRDVEVRGRAEPLSVFVIDDAARLPDELQAATEIQQKIEEY